MKFLKYASLISITLLKLISVTPRNIDCAHNPNDHDCTMRALKEFEKITRQAKMEECRVEALKKVQEREELYKGDSIIKQSRNYGPGTTHKHYSRSKTKITKGKKTRVRISESRSSSSIDNLIEKDFQNQRSKRAAEGFRPDRTNIGKNYYSKVLLYSTKTYKVTIDDKTVECECYSQCQSYKLCDQLRDCFAENDAAQYYQLVSCNDGNTRKKRKSAREEKKSKKNSKKRRRSRLSDRLVIRPNN